MYDIITLGAANVDAFVETKSEIIKHHGHLDLAYLLGGKLLIDKLSFSTGGGATNTAVAFSRLGLKTGCICAIGKDANGQSILEEMKSEKIDFLGNMKTDATGYSIVLPSPYNRVILVYKGANNELSWKDVNLGLFHTRWLYVSTMLGKSFETTKKLIKYSKKKGVKIALNLSLYLAKKGVDRLSDILEKVDILILNKEEAATLTGKEKYKEIIRKIREVTQAIVVITDGQNPVYAYDLENEYIKKIKKIKPADSTGAGDAFAAGFVYGMMKQKGIKKSLDYGFKEAASVLKYIGAKNNLLQRLN